MQVYVFAEKRETENIELMKQMTNCTKLHSRLSHDFRPTCSDVSIADQMLPKNCDEHHLKNASQIYRPFCFFVSLTIIRDLSIEIGRHPTKIVKRLSAH